jgi:hypothetical protein
MANLRNQKSVTEELKQQQKILDAHNDTAKSYKQAEEEILRLRKESAGIEANSLGLSKQIENLQDSILGKLGDRFNLEENILSLKDAQKDGDKATQEGAIKYAALLESVASGATDLEGILKQIAKDGDDGLASFGPFVPLVHELAEVLRSSPNLQEIVEIEQESLNKIGLLEKGLKKVQEAMPGVTVAAGIALAVKAMTDFVNNAVELRQELGISVGQSAKLSLNVTAAEKTLKLMGGRAGEVKNFTTAIAGEFGNVGEISFGVAQQFAKISAFTGLSGQNAAVLAKQIQIIQGGSLETSLNMIETYDSIARAAGVAPGLVLADIAQSTAVFAKYAKDGGENIAEAAAQAAKLGINLNTVGQIAESLLNIETSLTNEMEAEVLLGRNLNLDKARELALMGDLEGLQKEITDGLVSQAEWSDMNVIQRKAMADAIGVSVQDMGKMIAGEQTSAQLAAERQENQDKAMATQQEMMKLMAAMHGLSMAMMVIEGARAGYATRMKGVESATLLIKAKAMGMSLATMVGTLGATLIGIAAIGGLLALAYGAFSKSTSLAGAEEGGEVTKTGPIMAHKGEVFSGTKNEMGFGADMTVTNALLKQNIAQLKSAQKENTFYLLQLKKEIGDLKLANA